MSLVRAKYDNNTYTHKLSETIGVASYMLDKPWNCSDCTFYEGGNPVFTKLNPDKCETPLIDIDSELIGITRKYSQCPSEKYLPNCTDYCKYKNISEKRCDFLLPEPTKISNPPCTLKEVGINRWEWLCKNPQENAITPFDSLINNRIVVKDNFRPHIDIPINQEDGLPPKCNKNIHYDWSQQWYNNCHTNFGAILQKCKN